MAAMDSRYLMRDYNTAGSEWQRLDELHNGIRIFLDGQLSLADISNPREIIDIGAGSGAWALQAAQMFPEAHVVASDISPLPPRLFPPNVTFEEIDILKPISGKQECFDVVHIRLVLYHILEKHIHDVLEKATMMLKPGGWLLIEDFGRHTGHETSKGPAMATFEKMYIGMLRSKGLDPIIGEHVQEYLKELNSFSEINANCERLVLTTNEDNAGSKVRALSDAVRVTIERLVTGVIGEDMKSVGLTPELQKAWKDERNDPAFHTTYDFWFTWSRKKM
ncbi:S-adenosyl-L-methionine-dependent methyltransferase [Desarmillaria tabescens]|uniref:S-adenosyl-L-methionine-dependent methyltransferase n=1 Tax=Armillaria tabescens TaxID=1929756 RepID=A0AA39N7P0_ARMTA|nr:S-adenosyl-L-methionine-dependent methyltransferase [Desarmillaria tabescens]KAK0460549.1 S-adenosyl-L-methionine-dependent methyltransferase [Desarmillaria tabescens]